MRKLLVVLILTLLAISRIFAQSKPDVFVKWAPASLAIGKITVGTEINFSPKSSINFLVGIPANTKKTIEYDDRDSEMESKAFSVLAGYRHYFGKKAARGVYVEPYAKYLRHEAKGILHGDFSETVTEMDTRTKYQGFGVGAQLGVQFILFKRATIDFYFLGLEANSAKFHSLSRDVASNLPWTTAESMEAKQDLEDAIDDIPILRDKMTVTVDQSKKTVTTDFKGFLPGLRIGASIGFKL